MHWKSALQQGRITVAGAAYDLSHLLSKAFQLSIPATEKYKAIEVTIQVEFTSHCVSFGADKGTPPLDFTVLGVERRLLDHREEERAFCFDRYRWSLNLPSIIQNLNHQKCNFTGHSNWMVVECINDQGVALKYEIFFRLKRESALCLRLVIESAYVRTNTGTLGSPTNRRSVVRFSVMVAKTLKGEPIRNPRS